MTESVLLRDLAREVGGPDRAVTLLDQVRAKVTEDPLGRLVISADAAVAVRDVMRDEEATQRADQEGAVEDLIDPRTPERE